MIIATANYPVCLQFSSGIGRFSLKTPFSATLPTRTFSKASSFVPVLSSFVPVLAGLFVLGGYIACLAMPEHGKAVKACNEFGEGYYC